MTPKQPKKDKQEKSAGFCDYCGYLFPYHEAKCIKDPINNPTLNSDKQDWKEKFVKWYLGKSPQVVMNWIEENIIQPLQSQDEALQKKVNNTIENSIRLLNRNRELIKESEGYEIRIKSLLNQIQVRDNENEALQKEVDELKAWKESAKSVAIDSQAIARALGVRLGESVHDKILPGIQALQKENQEFKEKITKLGKTMAEIIFPDTPIGELQKEVERLNGHKEDLLKEVKSAMYLVDVREKENQELKEALQYLMKGVEGLPPLTAIQGTLIHHFAVAKKALKNNV